MATESKSGDQRVYCGGVAQLVERRTSNRKVAMTKDMQTEPLPCWSGISDKEHSVTSRSNEKKAYVWYISFTS